MSTRYEDPSIRDLIGRTVDDGKAFVRAEIDLYRTIATAKATSLVWPVVMIVAAIFLVQAALTTLLAGVGLGLAVHLGPLGGFAVAALIGLAVAGLLAFLAYRSFAR